MKISGLLRQLAPPVEAALFYGLAEPAAIALEPGEWTDAVVEDLVQFRLAGHALALADDHGVALSAERRARLEHGLFGQTINALRLDGAAAELQQFLSRSGIASVALKGVALEDMQSDRCPRFYGDVDLLVAPGEFRRAIDAYRDAGYEFEHPSLWNRLFAKSVNLYDGEGRSVDMQRAIAPWCWTRGLRFRDLHAHGRTVEANGAFAVGTEHALVTIALAHAADLGDDHEKLVPWRDLALLAARADHDTVVRIARRAHVASIVAVMLDQLPLAVRPVSLVAALGGPRIPLTKRIRWRVLTNRAWAERYWFVRVTRNLPISRLIPGIIALPILPPNEQSVTQWWRSIGAVLLRRRAPVWQRS
jgi:hypothetical protein